MSAKLTIIFFILICFEIGALLIVLPWVPTFSWNENYLLVLASDKLHWPSLAIVMKSSYTRGAITGLGIVNVMIGLWEAANFTRTTRAFQRQWQVDENTPAAAAPGISDNRPASAEPAGQPRIDTLD
jgi:hypothetical protein